MSSHHQRRSSTAAPQVGGYYYNPYGYGSAYMAPPAYVMPQGYYPTVPVSPYGQPNYSSVPTSPTSYFGDYTCTSPGALGTQGPYPEGPHPPNVYYPNAGLGHHDDGSQRRQSASAHQPRRDQRGSDPLRTPPRRQSGPGPDRSRTFPQSHRESAQEQFQRYMNSHHYHMGPQQEWDPTWYRPDYENVYPKDGRVPKPPSSRMPENEFPYEVSEPDDDDDYPPPKQETRLIGFHEGHVGTDVNSFHNMLRRALVVVKFEPRRNNKYNAIFKNGSILVAPVAFCALRGGRLKHAEKALTTTGGYMNFRLSSAIWFSPCSDQKAENVYMLNSGLRPGPVMRQECAEVPCLLDGQVMAPDRSGTLAGTCGLNYYLSLQYKYAAMTKGRYNPQNIPNVSINELLLRIQSVSDVELSSDPETLREEIEKCIDAILAENGIDWDHPDYQILLRCLDKEYQDEEGKIMLKVIYLGICLLRRIQCLAIQHPDPDYLARFPELPSHVGLALAVANKWLRIMKIETTSDGELVLRYSPLAVVAGDALLEAGKMTLEWPHQTTDDLSKRVGFDGDTKSWYSGMHAPGIYVAWAFMYALVESGDQESRKDLEKISEALTGNDLAGGFTLDTGAAYFPATTVLARVVAPHDGTSDPVYHWYRVGVPFQIRFGNVKEDLETIERNQYFPVHQVEPPTRLSRADFETMEQRSNPLGMGVEPTKLKKLPNEVPFIQDITLAALEDNGKFCKKYGLTSVNSGAKYYRISPVVAQTTSVIKLTSVIMKPDQERKRFQTQLRFDVVSKPYPPAAKKQAGKEERRRILMLLWYDVQFVAAPECISGRLCMDTALSRMEKHHILHPSYMPTVISAHRDLVTLTKKGQLFEWQPGQDESKKGPLVILASESGDSQILARAWCSYRGYHAVVVTRRSCLACAIRTAVASKIHVVIVAESLFVCMDAKGKPTVVVPDEAIYHRQVSASMRAYNEDTDSSGRSGHSRRQSVADITSKVDGDMRETIEELEQLTTDKIRSQRRKK